MMVKCRLIPNFPGYFATKDGRIWSEKSNKYLSQFLNGNPSYLTVGLCKSIQGKTKVIHKQIHQLVLEAFVGLRPLGLECRHLDGNSNNNNFENLCWGTRSENRKDSAKHGTLNTVKLTQDDADFIRWVYSFGVFSHNQLSKFFNVCKSNITLIINNKIWRN